MIFLLYKCFSLFMCWVVSDYENSKLKDKQYKKKTSLKSYKTEIKILTYPGLANWALNNLPQESSVVTIACTCNRSRLSETEYEVTCISWNLPTCVKDYPLTEYCKNYSFSEGLRNIFFQIHTGYIKCRWHYSDMPTRLSGQNIATFKVSLWGPTVSKKPWIWRKHHQIYNV